MKLSFVKLGVFADFCPVVPASSKRDWMDASPQRFAYKCVPLVMANTSGYFIECPFNLRVRWDGSEGSSGLELECLDDDYRNLLPDLFASHFGSGILTFRMPWLIRSDTEGVGAEITGPPNMWIPGLTPLQGMVQTWGHASSATMNWRLMYSDTDFFIPAGFPIAFVRPFDFRLVHEMEVGQMRFADLDEAFIKDYQGWTAQRDAVLRSKTDVPGVKTHKGAYGKNRDSNDLSLSSNSYRPFRLPRLNVGLDNGKDSHEPE